MPIIYSMQGRQAFVRFVGHPLSAKGDGNLGTRGVVDDFSVKSAGRIRRYLRCCSADYSLFGTLTYPAEFPTDGRVFKAHLAKFVRAFKHKVGKCHRAEDAAKFSFFWFLEFQERGAPHFHFFTTHMPASARDKDLYEAQHIAAKHQPLRQDDYWIRSSRKWIATKWYEIVGSGDVAHFRSGTQLDWFKTGRGGTIKYATKYALKQKQKKKPEIITNIGRWWGISGMRAALSAAIVVSNRGMMSSAYKHERKKLVDWLELYQKEGMLDIHRDYHGEIRGWYCKTDQAMRLSWAKVNVMVGKLALELLLKRDIAIIDGPIEDELEQYG